MVASTAERTGIPWRRLAVLAWQGLRAHRGRAAASAVGISVGIATVIVIAAIGEGARQEVVRQVEEAGATSIFVRAAGAEASAGGVPLTLGDASRLASAIPSLATIAPSDERRAQVFAGGRRADARIVGTTAESYATFRLGLASGRYLAPEDGRRRHAVCVLGAGVARELFGLADPIGRRLQAGAMHLRVVGVLADRAELRAEKAVVRARDVNRDVYVPIELLAPAGTTQQRWPLTEIALDLERTTDVPAAATLVRSVLDRSSRGRGAYEVVAPIELLERGRQARATLELALMGIAALALFVGGIGISNVMFATVTERTAEIGVRRAVGASARDVQLQFLAESAALALGAGIAGTFFGLVTALALRAFASFPIYVSASAMLWTSIISITFGLVFGFHPARRASAIYPIEALRHE